MQQIFYDALIESVRCHSCIYDKRNKQFKNITAKEHAWKAVAEATGETMEKCRRKWMMLRERFSKEIKKRELPSGNEAVILEDDWPYFESMTFLKDFIKPRMTRKNVFNSSNQNDLESGVDFSPQSTTSLSGTSNTSGQSTTPLPATSNTSGELTTPATSITPSPSSSRKVSESTDEEYGDVRLAIKAAAESITKRNSVPAQSSNAVHENFMRSIVGLIQPLEQEDQDYAMSQMLQFVLQLRQDRLYPKQTQYVLSPNNIEYSEEYLDPELE